MQAKNSGSERIKKTAEYQARLNQVNTQQKSNASRLANTGGPNGHSISENLNVIMTSQRREERQRESLGNAFQSFFSSTKNTLNKTTGDRPTLEGKYARTLQGFAKTANNNNAKVEIHPEGYQHVLLTNPPNPNASLPVGYYLYRVSQGGVDQIHLLISHPDNIGIEGPINLSSVAPARIRPILNVLPWPPSHVSSKDITPLNKTLERWITSISQYNKTSIYLNDIFWRDDMTESFSHFLSIEARKPQTISGRERRSLNTENGMWANVVSSTGNGLAWMWYWGSPPRQYGHNTVINQTAAERQQRSRDAEIVPIISHIANRYIQENLDEIEETAREFSAMRS
ncbi:MAG: hypothetical protein CK424_02875 [Legionella sp.]|nr:MAG: hypothetical protein CK424_02875 [Legionella sp.]